MRGVVPTISIAAGTHHVCGGCAGIWTDLNTRENGFPLGLGSSFRGSKRGELSGWSHVQMTHHYHGITRAAVANEATYPATCCCTTRLFFALSTEMKLIPMRTVDTTPLGPGVVVLTAR